jgi:hypothetical protein
VERKARDSGLSQAARLMNIAEEVSGASGDGTTLSRSVLHAQACEWGG